MDNQHHKLTAESVTKYDEFRDALAHTEYRPNDKEMLYRALRLAEDNGWSISQLAKKCGVNNTILSRIFRGKYPADETKIISAIGNAVALQTSRSAGISKPEFVDTIQARNIFEAADNARENQTIIQIIGASQIGKTFACKHYAATRPNTIYTYVPRPASNANMARNLATACGVGTAGSIYDLTARIRTKLTPNHLVIIDEMQQLMLMEQRSGICTLEWLRLEIFDQIGCGVLMIADNAWGDAFTGTKAMGSMQRNSRRGGKLELPPIPTKQDIHQFSIHYGLPINAPAEAGDIIVKAARAYGMRVLSELFRSASKIAAKKGEPIAWTHFLRAYDTYAALNGKL